MKKWIRKIWDRIVELVFGGDERPDEGGSAVSEKLVFRYGGFRGDGALEDPNTQIGSFSMNSKKMSYKWTKGSLSNWGVHDPHDDGGALACAFFWSDSEKAWVGGKFEWVSTDRLTRGFENIYDGYKGWDSKSFFSAKRHAFCIVDKAGKRRTNLAVSD